MNVKKSEDVSVIEIHKVVTNFIVAKFWASSPEQKLIMEILLAGGKVLSSWCISFSSPVALGQLLSGKDGRNGRRG